MPESDKVFETVLLIAKDVIDSRLPCTTARMCILLGAKR